MKMMTMLAALGLAAATIAAPAAAQVNARQYDQQNRIRQGAESGRLTPHEHDRLQRQQGRIAGAEDRMRYRNGGRLSRSQRARLSRRQNRASANIRRQKHDWQGRRY